MRTLTSCAEAPSQKSQILPQREACLTLSCGLCYAHRSTVDAYSRPIHPDSSKQCTVCRVRATVVDMR